MTTIDLGPEELEHIDKLARAAIPGPWHIWREYVVDGREEMVAMVNRFQDRAYIAHMHPGRVLAMVERIRALEYLYMDARGKATGSGRQDSQGFRVEIR